MRFRDHLCPLAEGVPVLGLFVVIVLLLVVMPLLLLGAGKFAKNTVRPDRKR
jgi:hypothetical protein